MTTILLASGASFCSSQKRRSWRLGCTVCVCWCFLWLTVYLLYRAIKLVKWPIEIIRLYNTEILCTALAMELLSVVFVQPQFLCVLNILTFTLMYVSTILDVFLFSDIRRSAQQAFRGCLGFSFSDYTEQFIFWETVFLYINCINKQIYTHKEWKLDY